MELETFRDLDNAVTVAESDLHNLKLFYWRHTSQEIMAAEKEVGVLKRARKTATKKIKAAIKARVKAPASQVLILFYLEWKSTSEIAEMLNYTRRHVFRLKRSGVDAYNSHEKKLRKVEVSAGL